MQEEVLTLLEDLRAKVSNGMVGDDTLESLKSTLEIYSGKPISQQERSEYTDILRLLFLGWNVDSYLRASDSSIESITIEN